MPLTNSPSLIRQLLDLPAIAANGIEHSIVFPCLPEQAQQAVRAARSAEEKLQLASDAGDNLPAIAEMYEHFIAGPARRRLEGKPFANLPVLSAFPLPGVLEDADISWVRPGQRITTITAQGSDVMVTYADGETRIAGNGGHSPHGLVHHVHRAAYILGLTDEQ